MKKGTGDRAKVNPENESNVCKPSSHSGTRFLLEDQLSKEK